MTQHFYPAAPGCKETGGCSAEAAAAVAPDAATLRGQVLAALGQIERTGERRPNVSGMSAAVWRVAPK